MFKLCILAALVAIAAARPGYLTSSPVHYSVSSYDHEPAYATVGHIVKSVPTAVSHQSISQVHSSAHYVEPIVAPVVKTTYAAPVIKTIATPVVHASYAAAPVYKSYDPTPLYDTYGAGPVLKTYASTYGDSYSKW